MPSYGKADPWYYPGNWLFPGDRFGPLKPRRPAWPWIGTGRPYNLPPALDPGLIGDEKSFVPPGSKRPPPGTNAPPAWRRTPRGGRQNLIPGFPRPTRRRRAPFPVPFQPQDLGQRPGRRLQTSTQMRFNRSRTRTKTRRKKRKRRSAHSGRRRRQLRRIVKVLCRQPKGPYFQYYRLESNQISCSANEKNLQTSIIGTSLYEAVCAAYRMNVTSAAAPNPTDTTVDLTAGPATRIYTKTWRTDFIFRNNRSFVANLTIYEIVCKDNTSISPLTAIANAWTNRGTITDSNTQPELPLLPVGAKPEWSRLWKVTKKTSVQLSSGNEYAYSHKNGGKYYSPEENDQEAETYLKGRTKGVIIMIRGVPSHDSITPTQVGIGQASLDYTVRTVVRYCEANTNRPNFHNSTDTLDNMTAAPAQFQFQNPIASVAYTG